MMKPPTTCGRELTEHPGGKPHRRWRRFQDKVTHAHLKDVSESLASTVRGGQTGIAVSFPLLSGSALVQSGNESADHLGNDLKLTPQLGMVSFVQQAAASGNLKQWDALLSGTARDRKEVPPVGFGEAAVAFGEIRRNRDGCPV